MASTPTREKIDLAHLHRRCETFKVTYETRDDALEGAERGMEAGSVDPGCHLTPYLCTRCGHWHVRNRRIC